MKAIEAIAVVTQPTAFKKTTLCFYFHLISNSGAWIKAFHFNAGDYYFIWLKLKNTWALRE